eukprot:gene5982-7453_t
MSSINETIFNNGSGGLSSNTTSEQKSLPSFKLSLVNIFGGLVFGYNTGVIAGVLNLPEWKAESDIKSGLLTCSILIGAMVGSLLGGIITEKWGRKIPMLLVSISSIIGAIGSALVPSYWYIVGMRFVLGLGVGMSAIVCPTYVSEMAIPEKKGSLGTVFQVAITVGIFLGDIAGFALKNVKYDYRWMFGIGCAPGFFLLGLIPLIPESFKWKEKKLIKESTFLLLNNDSNNFGIKSLLSKPIGRFALFIGCILAINNQLTGINAFMFFSPSIFETAGISGGSGSMIATICLVGWNVITTLISTFLIDRLGRRKLMLFGSLVMTISCIALAILFLTIKGTALGVLSIVLLFIFIAGFEAGAGPLFWIMVIEIFPEEMRDIGSSILNAIQWIFNIALSFSFLQLVTLIGQSAIFWIFGGIGLGTIRLRFCRNEKTTDSNHAEFQKLVVLLDKDLAIRDGEDKDFYAQYNTIDAINHVVVAYEGDVAVGCGAIKFYEEGVAELKRMYVDPNHRRKGIAGAVINELEKWARELQYLFVILETGIKYPEAISLYQYKQYKITERYGQYINATQSVCMRKEL